MPRKIFVTNESSTKNTLLLLDSGFYIKNALHTFLVSDNLFIQLLKVSQFFNLQINHTSYSIMPIYVVGIFDMDFAYKGWNQFIPEKQMWKSGFL